MYSTYSIRALLALLFSLLRTVPSLKRRAIVILNHLAVIANHLPAAATGHLSASGAGQIVFADINPDFFDPKERAVRHTLVCFKLLGMLFRYFRCLNR